LARAKSLSTIHKFRVSVPQQTFDYIELLAKKGKLAATVPDVAAAILIEDTERRLAAGYHLKDVLSG
jgi:hypothetical protein